MKVSGSTPTSQGSAAYSGLIMTIPFRDSEETTPIF